MFYMIVVIPDHINVYALVLCEGYCVIYVHAHKLGCIL